MQSPIPVEVVCVAKPTRTATKPCGIRLVKAPYGHLAHDGRPIFAHYPKPKEVHP
jgi:hypothetical protein